MLWKNKLQNKDDHTACVCTIYVHIIVFRSLRMWPRSWHWLTTTNVLAEHVMHITEMNNKDKECLKISSEVGHSASRPRALFTCHIRLMWSCWFFPLSFTELGMGPFQWTESDLNSLQVYHTSHVMVSFWNIDIKTFKYSLLFIKITTILCRQD